MNELTYSPREIIPARELSESLFDAFIAWIDRSEKTAKTYITNLRQFAAWLRYTAITRPVREDVISYRQWLTSEHDAIQLDSGSVSGWTYRTDTSGHPLKIICKANTIAQYLRSVRQFFRWTAAEGLYPDIAQNIHAPKVRNDTHRKDALTAEEVLTIEKSITTEAETRATAAAAATKDTAGRIQRADEQGKRLFAMYVLTVNAGLRTVEISRANIKDIVTRDGQTWLYIWGKGHAEPDQKKAIAPEVMAAIKDYLQSRTDKPTSNSPLFVSTGNRSKGQRIDPATVSKMLKKAMIQAGFNSERITPHSLRHSTGQAVQKITGDLYATQKYMRHSNPATTEIYLHDDEETQQQEAGIAQELFNRFHGVGSTDNRQRLEQLINRMTPAQIEQLTNIAAAMTR